MKKKHSKKKEPLAKQSFLQETAQWRKDIFVCSGMSAKEILTGIKRFKPKKWILDFVESKQKDWQELIDNGCAFVAMEGTHGAFIVCLRPFSDNWEFWETLVHELAHLVDGMAERQHFQNETEARAYLQEFLFREIRRKLMGLQPKRIK